MYKVLIPFTDDRDAYHVYDQGDDYPREGYEPDEERIEYLLSEETRFGKKGLGPVIAEVEDGAPIQQDGPDHKPPDESSNGPGDDAGGGSEAEKPEQEQPAEDKAKGRGKAKKE